MHCQKMELRYIMKLTELTQQLTLQQEKAQYITI